MDRAVVVAALPKSARRLFDAIEQVAGDQSVARISFLDFQCVHGLGRLTVTRWMPLLRDLGLVEIEIGPQRSNLYRLSRRWAKVDEATAKATLVKMRGGRSAP